MMNDFIIVFSAELLRRLKSKPFQLGVIFGVLGILALTKFPALVGNAVTDNGAKIVLAGDPALSARAKPLLSRDFTVVAVEPGSRAPSLADLKAHGVSSWVILERNPKGGLHFTVYAKTPKSAMAETISDDLTSLNIALATSMPRERIHELLSVHYDIHGLASKFASAKDATAAWGVSYALLMLLYVFLLLNGQLLMASVAEEKTSRIAELLVASISPVPLLYGKIAASTVTGILQMVIWVVAGLIFSGGSSAAAAAGTSSAQDFGMLTLSSVSPFEAVSFLVLFVLGFLQYSMLFAAVGSLINRTEDLGSISLPIIIPVVFGLMLSIAALWSPDSAWATVASFVPLVSPFVLFARIAMSNVPVWQLALGFALNLAAAWAIAVLAGKLYRVGMLLYGRPPSIAQVWNVLRT